MRINRVVLCAFALCACGTVCAQKTATGNASPTGTQLARGKYLVERVAMCGDCHTPHNERGEPIAEKKLQGAPLPFKALVPMPFAKAAPAIAGLPGWTDEDAVRFLMTGTLKGGGAPAPPMPPYRLSQSDAQAVVMYLRSVGKSQAKATRSKPTKTDKTASGDAE